MFGIHGKIRTHAGQRPALLEHLLKAANSMREMEGCYLYVINSVIDDPDTLWIFEVWRSQADHQASLSNDEVKAVIQAARPLIADMFERVEVIPVGGKGLPVSTD